MRRPGRSRRPRMEELARQGMADDLLGEAGALDQPVEIDAGLDAELAAEEDDLLAADIAGRRLVPGKGAAAETAETGIEMIDSLEQPGIDIGDAEAARVVEMEADPQVGPALAHGADGAADEFGIGPAHRVADTEPLHHSALPAGPLFQRRPP